MERLTAIRNGVPVYVGPECEYDTGMISAELGSEHIRQVLTRLAAYEDTGLTPEEIMVMCSMDCRAKMAELLRMEESKPLTLEQLWGMKLEEWVWIEILEPSALRKTKSGYYRKHGDFTCGEAFCCGWPEAAFEFEDYGNTWLAYRRKPEEGSR